MYKILKKEKLAENIYLMEIEAPDIAKKAQAGQHRWDGRECGQSVSQSLVVFCSDIKNRSKKG